jgi:hypothetical protein
MSKAARKASIAPAKSRFAVKCRTKAVEAWRKIGRKPDGLFERLPSAVKIASRKQLIA